MHARQLYVILVISNPVRYRSRYKLHREFEQHMLDSGVTLVVVEHAFGERPFEVTSDENPNHVQVRGGDNHEIWLKESLIKLGYRHIVTRLDPAARYIAWIDGDLKFVREDWAEETLHALQHYAVVQPWEHAIDLGPKGSVLTNEWGSDVDRSFCAAFAAGQFEIREGYGRTEVEIAAATIRPRRDARDTRSHFGYAWAIRRDVLDKIGGPLNWLVTGSADYHMALGFAGMIPRTLEKHEYMASPGYRRRMLRFHELCEKHVQRNIGFIPGTVLHGFHGYKHDRQYISRQQVIVASGFDPDVDLVEDAQGLPVLTGENWALRDGLRAMFRARNEDRDVEP